MSLIFRQVGIYKQYSEVLCNNFTRLCCTMVLAKLDVL